MIFNFPDGTTKIINCGHQIKGIRGKKSGRPVSVTLTAAELLDLLRHDDYHHALVNTLWYTCTAPKE